MASKTLYTVWSAQRDKKALIIANNDDPALYDTLILKASQKLEINGSSLVLESNGTPVQEEVLPHVSSEILILLTKEETWVSKEQSCTSLATTATVDSSASQPTLIYCTNLPNFEPDPDQQSIIISKIVNCNTEYHWSSVEIPWNKLTEEQISELDRGAKNRNTVTSLIHATVNEMRCIKHNIPSKAFKVVAKKIIDKYPDIFRDVDEDGVVLGDGSHSLVCKLQDRNNYLNRPHKRKNNLSNPVPTKKKFTSARAGCINWAPTPESDNSPIKENEKKIEETNENFYNILEKSYSDQRNFINRMPKIAVVKEKWPILCSMRAIFWHFQKLTNSDIYLINDMTGEKFKKFLQDKLKDSFQHTDVGDNVLKRVVENLAMCFKEDIKYLILQHQNLEELNIHNDDIPITPCIIEINDSSPDSIPAYFVFVEKEQINNEPYDSFDDALKVCFAIYFIFNLQYPKQISTVLELIQRMFLKIHPDAGSKSKKVNPTKKKVFNFMNRFREFSG